MIMIVLIYNTKYISDISVHDDGHQILFKDGDIIFTFLWVNNFTLC